MVRLLKSSRRSYSTIRRIIRLARAARAEAAETLANESEPVRSPQPVDPTQPVVVVEPEPVAELSEPAPSSAEAEPAQTVVDSESDVVQDIIADLITNAIVPTETLELEPTSTSRIDMRASSDSDSERTEELSDLGESLSLRELDIDESNMYCGDDECRRTIDTDMVNCTKCKVWYHFACEKIDLIKQDSYQRYVCRACEKRGLGVTVWLPTKIPTRTQYYNKKRRYYEITGIFGIRGSDDDDEREFLVGWKGYKERTWVAESWLDGCIETLQRYLRRKNRRLSRIQGLVGASSELDSKIENWKTIPEIIQSIVSYRNRSAYKSDIILEEWSWNLDRDSISFFNYEHHCYVILYLAKKGFGYIADGTNVFLEDPETRREVRESLCIRLVPVEFHQQFRQDLCASSAAMIAIGFLSAYKNRTWPEQIRISPYERRRIVDKLHPKASESSSIKKNVAEHLECSNCGKKFRTCKRASSVKHMHEVNCKRLKM